MCGPGCHIRCTNRHKQFDIAYDLDSWNIYLVRPFDDKDSDLFEFEHEEVGYINIVTLMINAIDDDRPEEFIEYLSYRDDIRDFMSDEQCMKDAN